MSHPATVVGQQPAVNAYIDAAVHTAQLLGKPICKYGTACYRGAATHFAEFRHPHREQSHTQPQPELVHYWLAANQAADQQRREAREKEEQEQRNKEYRRAQAERAEHIAELSPYIAIDEQKEGWKHRTESKTVQALRVLLTDAFTSTTSLASSALSTPTHVDPSQHRAKRRKATAADRSSGLSHLLAHDTFDPNVVELTLQYAYVEETTPCFHNTFLPKLEPAEGVSPLLSKWAGVPYLHTGESWPTCGECKSALSFFFQLRQGDYPTILQHALTMSPQPPFRTPATDTHHSDHSHQQTGSRKRAIEALDEDETEKKERDADEKEEVKDAHSEATETVTLSKAERASLAARRDGVLFQFFLCTSCTPQYQCTRLPSQDGPECASNRQSLIRLIDPSNRPAIAGLTEEGGKVCAEQRLTGWEELEDFPSEGDMELIIHNAVIAYEAQQDAPEDEDDDDDEDEAEMLRDDLTNAASSVDREPHMCDRMGGFPYW